MLSVEHAGTCNDMMAVFKRLAMLPDETLIYPGHEYDGLS